MRPRAASARSEAGFTIVEVIAAMVVLLVGLGGTLSLYEDLQRTASGAKLRDQGTALQRELVEATRALRYAELGPSTVVPRLQAQPGLADASAEAGWQLRRRGITYTVAVGACTVDDPRDSTGAHPTTTFCLTGAGATTSARCRAVLGSGGAIQGVGGATPAESGDCGLDTNLDGQVDGLHGGASGTGTDETPDDFKRIVVLVRWTNGTGSRYVLADSTVPSPGAAGAVPVSALTVSPALAGPDAAQVLASATTARAATTVAWTVDGAPGDVAAMAGAGTSWSFTWSLGSVTPAGDGATPAADEIVDGTYVIAARAYDEFGQAGPERAEAVIVDRRAPFAVVGQVLRNDGASVVVAWTPSRERDITGYRVLRRQDETTTVVCAVATAGSCRDDSPPAGPLSYWVVALDATRVGDAPAEELATTGGAAAPAPPTELTATATTAGIELRWTAPAGDEVSYRIYRDGTALGDLLGTAESASFTDTVPGSTPRQYWVSAVSASGTESAPVGPVSP